MTNPPTVPSKPPTPSASSSASSSASTRPPKGPSALSSIDHQRLPGALSIGLVRATYEIRLFFRSKEAVLFTFLFPIMLLLLFGSIFSGDVDGTNIPYTQVLCSGILASSIASVTFVNLAISIANEREDGSLKRLAGTPMPKVSYFMGKIGLVFMTGIAEVALVLLVGTTLFDLRLPSGAGRWFTFVWTLLLGLVACTLMGIAMSSVPKSAKSAAAVVNLPFVALQFISGVFVPFWDLSPTLRGIASLLPLKWMAQGFRSVFLPDTFLKVEPGGSWQAGPRLIVLVVWCLAAALLCMRTFRWTSKN